MNYRNSYNSSNNDNKNIQQHSTATVFSFFMSYPCKYYFVQLYSPPVQYHYTSLYIVYLIYVYLCVYNQPFFFNFNF